VWTFEEFRGHAQWIAELGKRSRRKIGANIQNLLPRANDADKDSVR